MLAEEIEHCEQYLKSPNDDMVGQKLYVEITGRYDSVISGLGNGLYQYYAEPHFYDPEVSCESLTHNLQVLREKMVSYHATRFPAVKMNVERNKTQSMYDVFYHMQMQTR